MSVTDKLLELCKQLNARLIVGNLALHYYADEWCVLGIDKPASDALYEGTDLEYALLIMQLGHLPEEEL